MIYNFSAILNAVSGSGLVKEGEDTLAADAKEEAVDYTGLACLGLARFVLASGVILFHLWTWTVPDLGRHCVIGFFCISGFLITKICRENYAGRPGAFLLNRFLRIYPSYLFAVLLSLAIEWHFPEVAAGTYLHVVLPDTLKKWVLQFVIFRSESNGIVEPAWTLGIELCYYLVIGLITCRSKKLTYGCFIISSVISIMAIFHYIPLQFYFSTLADGSLFFSGSIAYFLSQKYTIPRRMVSVACVGYIVTALGLPHMMQLSDYSGPIPNLFLLLSACNVFVLLIGLKDFRIHQCTLTAVSYYLGRLAYPMFLLHWSVSMPFCAYVSGDNGLLFISGYSATLLVSVFVVQCIDLPIERLRKRVRNGKAL